VNVGPKESLWGTRIEDLPPSLGDYPPFNSSDLFQPLVVPPDAGKGVTESISKAGFVLADWKDDESQARKQSVNE